MNTDLKKKIDFALNIIMAAEIQSRRVGQPLEVCYSGGKDSDVILHLCKTAGANYRAIYKQTSIDPPGTRQHAEAMGAEVIKPSRTFFQLVEAKGLPSRVRRFCCEELKEYKVLDYQIVGVRRAESVRRAARYKEPEQCRMYRDGEKVRQYFPILEWSDKDIAEYIAEYRIQCAPVYYDEEGNFHVERRFGCICCPLQSTKKRIEEFGKYPHFADALAHHLEKYRQTHPKSKATASHCNVWQQLVHGVIYPDRQGEWREITTPGIFDDELPAIDWEEYFKIKTKIKL